MRTIFVATCLVTATILNAEQETSRSSVSMFSYVEWQEIFSKRRCSEDYVVLVDGSKFCGKLDRIPTMDFSFTNLTMNIKDVAAISVSPQGSQYKLQYVTRDGQNFIGSLGRGKFVFWVVEPTLKDPLHTVRKEIDPKAVSFILLKERDRVTTTTGQEKVASISLRSGDQIPVVLPSEPIAVTDGWSEEYIPTDRIVELYFEGGVYGKILDDGNPKDLHFLFLKDRFLTVNIPGQDNYLRIPWDQIEYIQANNGGFKNDQERRLSSLHAPPDDVEEALQSGVISTQPDAIGLTHGDLLTDAFGAVAIPAKSFEGFEALGNVMLQPEPLFSKAEENEWVDEVAFHEETAPEIHTEIAAVVPEEAAVTPEEIEEVTEETLFDNIAKVDVDPPTFDLPAQDDIYASKLTPDALAIINNILADDEEGFDDYDMPPFEDEVEDAPVLTDQAIAIIEDILADDELDENDFPLIGKAEEHAPILEEEAYAIVENLLQEPKEVISLPVTQEVFSPVVLTEPKIIVHAETILAKPETKPRDVLWDAVNDQEDLTQDEISLLSELFMDDQVAIEEYEMAFIAQAKLRQLISVNDMGDYKASIVPTAHHPTLVIHVPAFYLDRHPVTNAQYALFVRSTGAHPPVHWIHGNIPEGQESKPVVNVSYSDAKHYAAWAGKRLPTETDLKRAIKAGVIKPSSKNHKEWTATVGKPHYRVVFVGDDTQMLNENYIDHRLGFRTALTEE